MGSIVLYFFGIYMQPYYSVLKSGRFEVDICIVFVLYLSFIFYFYMLGICIVFVLYLY